MNKPASQITLAEVKNRFPGVGGVFLFKTSGMCSRLFILFSLLSPSATSFSFYTWCSLCLLYWWYSDAVSHHWSVIVDNWAQVPEIGDGEIFVQIKMKNKSTPDLRSLFTLPSEVTVVELYEDNNTEPSYFRLSKPSTEVTLQDIRSWYGPSGLFFFKTMVCIFQLCSVSVSAHLIIKGERRLLLDLLPERGFPGADVDRWYYSLQS